MTFDVPVEFHRMGYPERYEWARENDVVLDVYVPTNPRTTIAARSGIVGALIDGRIQLYYEGWVNGAMQYRDLDERGKWEAGVSHAAGRLLVRYPTTARCSLMDLSGVLKIGTFHAATDQVIVDDEDALARWLA